LSKKGKFIVLEGLDGAGSTTQLYRLNQWFEENKEVYGAAWSTFEPTDGPVGQIIRLALKKRLQQFDEKTMALLFAADRTDHIYRTDINGQEPGILYKLNQGINVITDRYLLSSLAYQGRELGLEWVYQINAQAITPDLIIFIDLSAEQAAERMKQSRSHQDLYEDIKSQQEIQQNYEKAIAFLQEKNQKIVRINGNASPEEVHLSIVDQVINLLKQ